MIHSLIVVPAKAGIEIIQCTRCRPCRDDGKIWASLNQEHSNTTRPQGENTLVPEDTKLEAEPRKEDARFILFKKFTGEIEKHKLRLRQFAEERDWDQFHSPKNLSMALSAEVAEIVEHFQWLTEEQSKQLSNEKLGEVETELADTLIYLIRLADKLDVDLLQAALSKIDVNEQKYPVDKAKGNAKKYTELGK